MQHSLLNNDKQNDTHDISISQIKEVTIKTTVTFLFTLPFVLSSVDMAKRYPVFGVIFGIIANTFISRIAWSFYARHFIELFDEEHELTHIAEHLVTSQKMPEIKHWPVQKKLVIVLLAIGFTLPLGLTKIGFEDNRNPVETALKLAYLLAYAVIDAGPHVNHLQLQQQAISKFLELSWLTKAWIIVLMGGHALGDSADLWNATGFWFYWVCAALPIEFYLANVEAVAHQQPHFPEFNYTSAAKFIILFLGAVSMAMFNWYNTFKDSTLPMSSSSKIIFILLQTVNVFFMTFEAWHHEVEASPEHAAGCTDPNGAVLGQGASFYSPLPTEDAPDSGQILDFNNPT